MNVGLVTRELKVDFTYIEVPYYIIGLPDSYGKWEQKIIKTILILFIRTA